jgi:ribose-phosphate pyrophosphokinase
LISINADPVRTNNYAIDAGADMASKDFMVFALNGSRPFGEKVAAALDRPLAAHEEREFEDGEHKARPLVSVRGRDVFVIHSLYSDAAQSANDKLCRLLFFLNTLKDASADRVTAIVPYLCYARKDRRTQPRDPVTTRYVAALFEAVGTTRIVTLDVHNLAAFQNAFRCVADHLEAKTLFARHFSELCGGDDLVVVSPDVGGIKRAELFREALAKMAGKAVGAAFMEKRRSGGVVSGETVVGDVSGKVCIVIDDLISTGTTLARAAKACKALGADRVYAAATHGLFVGKAGAVLAGAGFEKTVVTNAVPPFRLAADLVERHLTVLDVAPLVAKAIERIHTGGSVADLLAND